MNDRNASTEGSYPIPVFIVFMFVEKHISAHIFPPAFPIKYRAISPKKESYINIVIKLVFYAATKLICAANNPT